MSRAVGAGGGGDGTEPVPGGAGPAAAGAEPVPMGPEPAPELPASEVPEPAPPAAAAPEAAATSSWTDQVGEPTRLLLLRHGQTELSVQRRYSGHGDPELTALGHAQAAAAAARLAELPDVAAVLSSPLRRARQTAAAVAEATGAPLVTRDGLIETDFGGWEGLTFAEARERDPELHASWLGSEDVAPPGGESFAEVGRRIETELKNVLADYPGHGRAGQPRDADQDAAAAALQGGPEILYRLHLDLAASRSSTSTRTAAPACGWSTTSATTRRWAER